MKTQKIDGKEYADVPAVAERLRLSAHYVRIQIRWGQIPAVKVQGRYWVAVDDVEREHQRRLTPVPVVPRTRAPRKGASK